MRTLTLIDPQPMETLPTEGFAFISYTHPIELKPSTHPWNVSNVSIYRAVHKYTFHAWSYTATFAEEQQ